MSDSGADIRYNAKHGRFTMKPRGSDNIYSFCRRDIPGSDGRFYVCDTRTMIAKRPTFHPRSERTLVATVAENMQKYSKREVESAVSARELLARMGYPSVENAIQMIRGGDNMGVTERDFRIAHDIWGKDVTSMRGKTKKRATAVADMSVRAPLVQVLSVDIMFLAVSLKTTDMDRAQRTAAAVKAGLDNMLGTMAGQGFDVTTIYSDGEGAIGKQKYHLNRLGIELGNPNPNPSISMYRE
jgi:hypothetical protein